MFGFAKSMIALSALVATGVVVADAFVGRAETMPTVTPASTIADRHPDYFASQRSPGYVAIDADTLRRHGSVVALAISSSSAPAIKILPPLPAGCAEQTWPNMTADCLVSPDGAPVKRPVRFVTVERAARS
jgi:hypothetical protein